MSLILLGTKFFLSGKESIVSLLHKSPKLFCLLGNRLHRASCGTVVGSRVEGVYEAPTFDGCDGGGDKVVGVVDCLLHAPIIPDGVRKSRVHPTFLFLVLLRCRSLLPVFC